MLADNDNDYATPKKEPNPEDEKDKTFFQKNVLDYKEMMKEEFSIPHMLQEKDKQMKKEYDQREGIDINEIGVTQKEFKELKELDHMYGNQTTKDELEEIENEEE